jgi:hypothetical protein
MSPLESAVSTRRRIPEGDLDSPRAQAPLALRAFDCVGGERDRVLVGARASEQLGVDRVQRPVALEPRLGEQRPRRRQAASSSPIPPGRRTTRSSSTTGDGLSLARARF